MGRLRVKICGITRPADAACAAALGADAIGLVFWPGSPRAVTVEQAAEIARAAGPLVTRVGVFVDELPERIREIASAAGLDCVQLHGDEPAERCAGLGLRAIKAFRVGPGFDAAVAARYPADWILLDARVPGRPGGTGECFDWSLARGVPRERMMLAGGIGADNLADAVAALAPAAVDVSSAVERAPGVKDAALLERLFEVVRSLS